MVDFNKIALSFGDTHIFSATRHYNLIKIKKKNAAFSIVLIIQHRDYNAKPIRDGNLKRWVWGKENLLFLENSPQKHFKDEMLAKCVLKLFVVKL